MRKVLLPLWGIVPHSTLPTRGTVGGRRRGTQPRAFPRLRLGGGSHASFTLGGCANARWSSSCESAATRTRFPDCGRSDSGSS